MFLNARPNPGEYSPCKILHGFKSFVDFLNVVAGLPFSYRGQIRSLLTRLVS